MADVSEALERLADLRDRGILSQAEFDAQKSALLNPVAAPAPIAARTGIRSAGLGMRIGAVIGGIVLLGLVLWALGILPVPHYSRPETQAEIDAELKDDSPKPHVALGALPAPAPAGQVGAPASSATSSPNPLIGEWANDGAETADCPAKVAFSASTLTITTLAKGTPEVEIEPISYAVQSPTTVLVTNSNRPDSSMPVQIQNGHLNLTASCSMHR